jgi:hypothetical protein
MKVVVQSSSLFFTLLSIILNVPITRVQRKPAGREYRVAGSTPERSPQPLPNSRREHSTATG